MDDKSFKAIEKRLTRLEKAVFGSKERQEVKKPAKGFGGATGGVRFLISKGQFRSKLGLAEVKTALAKNDYHYSTQAVDMALKRLAGKGGPLGSIKEGGKKAYVNRK